MYVYLIIYACMYTCKYMCIGICKCMCIYIKHIVYTAVLIFTSGSLTTWMHVACDQYVEE